MKRQVLMLGLGTAMLLAGCGGAPDVSINVEMPNAATNAFAPQAVTQFDTVWDTFERNYSYFDVKRVDWRAMRTRYQASAAASQSQAELNKVLVEMLGNLKDQHVNLVGRDGAALATYTDPRPANFDPNQLGSWFAGQHGAMVGSSLGYARVPGGAYLGIASWNTGAFSEADLNAVLDAVRDAPALVIDVRMNRGGNDGLAEAFAARFTDVPRIMHYTKMRNGPGHGDFDALVARTVAPRGPWTYQGKVLLLVGPRSASSNESFISLMRTMPNVTLIGERTAGASANPATYPLTNGWSFTVSRWVAYTADMQLIEGQGITPDVTVPATAQDFAAGQDPVLAAALRRMN